MKKLVGKIIDSLELKVHTKMSPLFLILAVISVASLTAYMFGDLINDLVFLKMKRNDKRGTDLMFVHRSLFSSFCGEIIDCMVFLPLLYAFIGGYGTIIQSGYQLFAIIIIQGSLKTLVEVVLSPVVVVIVKEIRHYEQSLTAS